KCHDRDSALRARMGEMRRLLVGVMVLALGVTGCCFFGDRPGGPRTEVVHRPANLAPAGDYVFVDVAVVERPYGDHFLDQEVWEGGDEQGYLETKALLEENGLRVCQLGGVVPAGLQALLSPRYCPDPRRLHGEPGKPIVLTVGPVVRECNFGVSA